MDVMYFSTAVPEPIPTQLNSGAKTRSGGKRHATRTSFLVDGQWMYSTSYHQRCAWWSIVTHRCTYLCVRVLRIGSQETLEHRCQKRRSLPSHGLAHGFSRYRVQYYVLEALLKRDSEQHPHQHSSHVPPSIHDPPHRSERYRIGTNMTCTRRPCSSAYQRHIHLYRIRLYNLLNLVHRPTLAWW